MYRLLADVFNDASFVMDCLSPTLPKYLRVPLLCVSTVSRGFCGVAGGSSKAILSAHFAKADNLGELNAKDSSQETVISLLGMWAGGAVVSRVETAWAVWVWLFSLLAVHLATNYAAVRAVVMTTLNRQRADIVFSSLIENGKTLRPVDVAHREFIFEWGPRLRWNDSTGLCSCQIGVSLQDLLQKIGGHQNTATASRRDPGNLLRQLLDIFKGERYLLWLDDNNIALIALLEKATSKTKMKAWCHALRLAYLRRSKPRVERDSDDNQIALLTQSLQVNNDSFEGYFTALGDAGWNLSSVALEMKSGKRLKSKTEDAKKSQ